MTKAPTTIGVGGESPYEVVVGHDVMGVVASMLPGAHTVLVVADEAVTDVAGAVRDALVSASVRTHLQLVDGGESSKSLTDVARLWDVMGNHRLTRSDAVVAVGGGATTDAVGFAAASWLRGVRVVHVPTTLLAMVDAAVGGKTGINTAAGKNLVGAFHPPAGVVVDLDVLAQLPDVQWVNGMAEVVKAGLVADPVILDLIEVDPAGARTSTGPHARELVERSIHMKADVVSEDLHDTGRRESLNYGHTLGHAIERLEDYRLPHGHGVAIGMVYAAELARLAGRLDNETVSRHREVLDALGLPLGYPRTAWPLLLDSMRIDKKSRGSTLRFVVLDALGKPGILTGPPDELLAAAYTEVSR